MTTEEAIRSLKNGAAFYQRQAEGLKHYQSDDDSFFDPADLRKTLLSQADAIKTVLTRLAAVEHERDEMTAYAAFIQAQTTVKQDFSQWSPSEAVEWVRKVASGTHDRLAWRRDERSCLEDCRRAVGLAAAGIGRGDKVKGATHV